MFDKINTKIMVEDIFKDEGVLAGRIPGYQERPSQTEIAKTNETALASCKHTITEGPCGTGKTFAYLIPVLKEIAESDFTKKAVVVTSGISLQEQLASKDVPFSIEVVKELYPNWPSNFTATLLKGRQNFVCNEKFERVDLGKFSGISVEGGNFKEISDWYAETKTGDLSELSFVPDQKTMELIACTTQGECTGRNCDKYSECFYQKHKGKLAMSNLIVTNYHMLFSDMKIGNKILPKYDILVFDEAHEAAGVYRDFMSVRVTPGSFTHIRNKITEITNKCAEFKEELAPYFEKIKFYSDEFFHVLDVNYSGKLKSPKIVESQKEIPDTDNIITCLKSLQSVLLSISEDAAQNIAMYQGMEDTERAGAYTSVLSISESLHEMIVEINFLLGNVDEINKNKNNVIWIEDNEKFLSISRKTVDVGDSMVRDYFSSEDISCLLTSATMSVGGDFSYIKEQLGLDKISSGRVLEYIGKSPFDLTEQQLWYLPKDCIDGNKQGFDESLPRHVLEIVMATGGGALCLFTSIRNMNNCYWELKRKLPGGIKILKQGDMPRTRLLEQFKEDSDSVLLATKSFFTGIDVQGDALRCVIIDKFPFPQPTDPIQQKLKERDNSFYKYSIPEMVISLKQAVGRGVRTVDDKSVIAILDGRMATARYKSKINNSFNYKKTGTRDLSDLTEFCGKYVESPDNYEDDDIPF